MTPIDPRIGFKDKGQPTQWPEQYGNGAPFRQGRPITRVTLPNGYFYALPAGVPNTPAHDELVAIAAGHTPVVPTVPVVEAVEQGDDEG